MRANVTIPQLPILYNKPFTAPNTPTGPIPVTAGYQNQPNFPSSMDYESEPVVVIKSAAFNISESDAFSRVLSYAASHDVPHRGWQTDRGGQP